MKRKAKKVKQYVTFNKAITREEAEKMFSHVGGYMMPNSEHNRKMMATLAHESIAKLNAEKKLSK
jgi:beta-glucosidase/6-phospho-beta-glucosidase/beta-galactosidase